MHLLDKFRSLRDSFLLVPGIFILAGIILAQSLIFLDRSIDTQLYTENNFLLAVGVEGARGILSALATTVLSVATMAFSITISVMSTASSSFGPRLVKNFMSDRGNQIVLGIFTSTFLYCLLVMRSVQGSDIAGLEKEFVPVIAVNVSVALALACVVVLIYFIHHIASGIQVSSIAKEVQNRFSNLIEKNFHAAEKSGEFQFATAQGEFDLAELYEIKASASGYILDIEYLSLAQKIKNENFKVRFTSTPGDHLIKGEVVAYISDHQPIEEEELIKYQKLVNDCISIGNSRTDHDDIRYLAQQLIELGVRALSPGTNDPYTLKNAVHELSVGLVRAAQVSNFADAIFINGQARIKVQEVKVADLIDLTFDDLRPFLASNPVVVKEVLIMAGKIFTLGTDPTAKARARWQAAVILQDFLAGEPLAPDKETVLQVYGHYFKAESEIQSRVEA